MAHDGLDEVSLEEGLEESEYQLPIVKLWASHKVVEEEKKVVKKGKRRKTRGKSKGKQKGKNGG